ncbi:unnamed protein product [Cylicocyclus nassatus]|uniref:Uncharacterized protein n=1 Tax=Cylicocyclus nassatus TaxID=53992 RepID=A0AA36M9E9_CYLNA|nr:unnamed protein product [Cylicocyclus nassatus]
MKDRSTSTPPGRDANAKNVVVHIVSYKILTRIASIKMFWKAIVVIVACLAELSTGYWRGHNIYEMLNIPRPYPPRPNPR